jgi:hypothetical protein
MPRFTRPSSHHCCSRSSPPAPARALVAFCRAIAARPPAGGPGTDSELPLRVGGPVQAALWLVAQFPAPLKKRAGVLRKVGAAPRQRAGRVRAFRESRTLPHQGRGERRGQPATGRWSGKRQQLPPWAGGPVQPGAWLVAQFPAPLQRRWGCAPATGRAGAGVQRGRGPCPARGAGNGAGNRPPPGGPGRDSDCPFGPVVRCSRVRGWSRSSPRPLKNGPASGAGLGLSPFTTGGLRGGPGGGGGGTWDGDRAGGDKLRPCQACSSSRTTNSSAPP